MKPDIPDDNWQPLSVAETVDLFRGAPFEWCLAGGYAIELFLGHAIRSHSDIDITIFRDDQLSLQQWLQGWELYAADPPGTLRRWQQAEYLPVGIHDIWANQAGFDAWQIQIMLTEVDGADWYSRRSKLVRGRRSDLMTTYDGVPCIRPEIQLLYKARDRRPKDEQDLHACLPRLNTEAKDWLRELLELIYPEGHPWLHLFR